MKQAMERIAEFERVSLRQFTEDWQRLFGGTEENAREIYESIRLPERATAGSAGYDFFLPVPVTLKAGESMVIPTGIRAKIAGGWVLNLYPRSGLGFKYGFGLLNTVGIIDSDYYSADNEGHIMAKVSVAEDMPELPAGKAFMQGVFLPFGITVGDSADGARSGGFGSTDV